MQVPPFSLSSQLAQLGKELDSAVLNVLHSGQFIGGPEVNSFEKGFSDFIQVPYVVGCNSGTDALVLALRALDVGTGDEVITSSFSFFATAEAISAVGARPVFVDIDPDNYLIDLELIEAAITPSSKAIIPVHLFGCPVNMERLMEIAKKYKLKVIEDCAQASGAEWKGISVGGWGDVGCFSFFPTKNLGAAGDAGAVSTKDESIANRIRRLAVHGMPQRYLHSELGYNSRLDAIQAAILNVKLPKLSKWIEARKSIANRYKELLQGVNRIQIPYLTSCIDGKHAWNQFVIRVPSSHKQLEQIIEDDLNNQDSSLLLIKGSRNWLKKSLESRGVNTIIYYPIPIHLQPAYQNTGLKCNGFTVTEKTCDEVLSLPIFPEITIDQQLHVVESIKSIMNNYF